MQMTELEEKPFAVQLAEITARLFSNCQEKEARHAKKYGVSSVEFRCIRILEKYKKLNVNQLAHKMLLSSSRITRIIDRLVAKDLVVRENCVNDRRMFHLYLTPRGNKLGNDLVQTYKNIHEEITEKIPAVDRKKMISMLEKLNEAMEKWLIGGP